MAAALASQTLPTPLACRCGRQPAGAVGGRSIAKNLKHKVSFKGLSVLAMAPGIGSGSGSGGLQPQHRRLGLQLSAMSPHGLNLRPDQGMRQSLGISAHTKWTSCSASLKPAEVASGRVGDFPDPATGSAGGLMPRSLLGDYANSSLQHSPNGKELPLSLLTSFLRREILVPALGLSFSLPLLLLSPLLPSAAHALTSPNLLADMAENVRLEDVDGEDLRGALTAAIGGDFETAEEMFGRLIERNGDSASMWSNRGSVRLSMGRFQEAVGDFTEAVRLAPDAAVPLLNRAIAYEALGRLDEAAEDCDRAIVNDPHESAAWFNLGNIEMKRNNHDRALEAYTTAATLSPGIAGYRLREAGSLYQTGSAGEAERLMRSLVRKYPNYAEAHAALAAVLSGDGRFGPAEEQLTAAVEYEPKFQSFKWVEDNVEWPPKLLSSYAKFLAIK